jgi:antitoxin HicB
LIVIVPHPRKDIPPGTVRSIYRQANWVKDVDLSASELGEGLSRMTHYIALIHKDADSCYGVSFPDVPGVITAADTLDEALTEAAEALAFAAEGWAEDTGKPFPLPRSLDDLRSDADFVEQAVEAVVAAVPFKAKIGEAV